MRRLRWVIPLCLLLLFVPIYLWKVQGIQFWGSGDGSNDAPKPRIKSKDERRVDAKDLTLGQLAVAEPVEFLLKCLDRYDELGIEGYTCTFDMHQRLNGKLNPPEVVECWFKEKPFSVLMHWKEGAGLATASLYVVGEHDGKMCARLNSFAKKLPPGYVKSYPNSDAAKAAARYSITEFGIRCGTERTYKAWKALKEQGVTLDVEYLGKRRVDEVGERECHIIRRHCNPPEEEGLTDITLYIDAETLFQLGSVLMKNDELIGNYFFKDIHLNPNLDENQFKPEVLKKY